MEVDCEKVRRVLRRLREKFDCAEVEPFLRLSKLTSSHMDELATVLGRLIEDPQYTTEIGSGFASMLLLIVAGAFGENSSGGTPDREAHRRKCVALSKLVHCCPDVLRFAVQYFRHSAPPFGVGESLAYTPKQKQKKLEKGPVSELELVRCCYRFLVADPAHFRSAWNWSEFFEQFAGKGCPRQRYYYNRILATVSCMTQSQLNVLDGDIPLEVVVREQQQEMAVGRVVNEEEVGACGEKIRWDFRSNVVTNVGDVMLPIFDASNCEFYRAKEQEPEELVIVDSTRLNVRSLALGVSSGRAICLSGPVGCGKTSLVEYLARKTGRIGPKAQEVERRMKKALKPSKKRKVNGEDEVTFDAGLEQLRKEAPRNGFLRIQLGDQTDSKMLLGQYRCTDTPGEFVWQPGVLTQAVMNGYWLLLEDLDSATQDVCTVLTNLLENNYLSVPGFRDCLRIQPGFQLFVTLRTHKSGGTATAHSTYSLLEKYLYTVNVLPLSRTELCTIICTNFPKLATVASRIVDIYLTFSSGCHAIQNNEIVESVSILEQQNSDVPATQEESSLPRFQHEGGTLGLPNSGRLVSTRDLIKLCRRSNPTFSVTSTECAYFVFQNAVDIFCSHLPAGDVRRNLVLSIGGNIGINKSRCDHLCEEYKPEVDVATSKEVKIGRVLLKRNLKENLENDENAFSHKKIRLDKNASSTVKTQDFKLQSKAPTFSFTRPASCLLERIAVSVAQNEPILLVGETGVGKTSSIQYLAYQTHHKLVVVNMNNQSDVSDLVGGFKPVDLSYVITPLRYEFEFLFNKTFNAQKNEKFLTNVSICYNRGEFPVLVKLMLKIAEKVFLRKQDEQLRLENIYEKWTTLQEKLTRLDSQLKNSVNVSFAFIPGSLVNCIRNGDWVLLDEINLASTETLECLSTILEPDGSIVLLEKGDFVPVKRHPDFRIFSCMNPNTDVGKKDLPVGIRNRFTEFFVDELVAENDLLILVNDYLGSTGIQKVRILNTVKLYRRLRALSQLELNDGLGNKPVFSLRTLCRALSICAKNLCGSIERNLYESFCLSFLTQLDLKSHATVLTYIQKTLLNDVHQAISQQIPKPADGEQLNFEGYWIEQGSKEVQECESYILTESVKNNLRDLARIISIGKLPVLLQGPTSAGKTSLIEYIAKRSGNVCLRINNHEHTDLQEYIGTYVADVTGKLTFKEGVLVEAMRNGFWIILDELNLAPSDILEALNRVLDDNRELFIPETQVVVKAHPNFMLFATQNPPGLYGGRKMLSRAFKNRFIELHFSEIPRAELEVILEKRCLIPRSYSQKMVKVMSELQLNRRSTAKQNFTLRDLFRWGNRYTYADKALLADGSYDWNQHLIDEGYLVLSSKIRNLYETKIIQEALYTHFRKRAAEDALFTLKATATSQVTRGILEQLERQTAHDGVVWTFDMRRMAVLTAKALQFNEPVLLVGPTGCGKTTICQILAAIRGTTLRILNCHMHTEGADFLGGLRPHRQAESEEKDSKQLFEWSDGPLVLSMAEGGFFLADEISLAEDSVLERLNCVLEPERTLLLAEKGGVSAGASEFVITASEGFQFLATMNPGGDFGKKELSPALRNRLTEIWCRATDSRDDLVRIAEHALKKGLTDVDCCNKLAQVIIGVVFVLKNKIDKLNFSIRDVLAWVAFINKNQASLSLAESLMYGLETVFLDSLEMLPYETFEEIVAIRKEILAALNALMQKLLDIKQFKLQRGSTVESNETSFGISPFYIELNPVQRDRATEFMFSAPTTQNNLFRLLSALSLDKAILLEGPPGVGKTSLVENLARAAGFAIVRINLCEHTDLADLFGTDLPADDRTLELTNNEVEATESKLGSFVWRDGPLLAALKAKNTWILLDELNLAPQSVLEGLNAILDHRGEVFIAELNKTFKLGAKTRIFAAQNPLRQGGGRKGLPQSFLNRFTKVYLRKLERADLLYVVDGKYREKFASAGSGLIEDLGREVGGDVSYFEAFNATTGSVKFDLSERMVLFSEALETGIANLEFGYKGGPFEANLRDILRWCELFFSERTGFFRKKFSCARDSYDNFLLVLFEKMKLVYYQRMRTDVDKNYILAVFSRVFACDAYDLEQRSQDIAVYWTDDKLYMGDLVLEKLNKSDEMNPISQKTQNTFPLLLTSQLETLRNVTECVLMEKPVILCGPSDSGKTKIINLLTTLSNKFCNVDTIDDSVTGSFQQFDFNRHLEEVSSNVEAIVMDAVKEAALADGGRSLLVQLIATWEKYVQFNDGKMAFATKNLQTEELALFRKRLTALQNVLTLLAGQPTIAHAHPKIPSMIAVLTALATISKNAETLNTGGHFEWVDSKVVKSLKYGQYICLEHVNLVSSAILDRLNPIFEPDGSLLISEKGVDANNESEIIRAHAKFRAFLTLDPKNGEISRAMRNRCIELALHKETYGDDDLRRLVFANGVGDLALINTILSIHKGLKKVSEFNQFGIAHVIKFAYLVAQNKRLGMIEEKCLLISALEVYVRSSNTDLLGYGLEFYRNALKTVIKDEIKNAVTIPNLVQLENVLLRSDNLTGLQLIKLQAEPLLTTLRCAQNSFPDVVELLTNIASAYSQQSAVTLDNVKYLFHLLYEVSSFEDVKSRRIYLSDCLKTLQQVQPKEETQGANSNGIVIDVQLEACADSQWKSSEKSLSGYRDLQHTKREKVDSEESSKAVLTVGEVVQQLIELNQVLSSTIEKFGKTGNLPWNRSMFPRIRDYQEDSTPEQHRISATLLLNTTLKAIEVQNATKLSKIDALSYSKAVSVKIINDTVEHKLVTQLYDFLANFKPLLEGALKDTRLDGELYTKLIGSYLWINRLIELSHQNLFINKEVNTALVDYITLHFKWIQKHCLSLLEGTRFAAVRHSLEESVQSSVHPLTEHRKLHAKRFLNNLPFYSQDQIEYRLRHVDFNEGLRLVPRLTKLYDYSDFLQRVALLNHSNTVDLRRSILAKSSWSTELTFDQKETEASLDSEDYRRLIALIAQFGDAQEGDRLTEILAQLNRYRKFVAGCDPTETYSYKFLVEMLPLLEYFLLKSLAGRAEVNYDYIASVRSLNLDALVLLKRLNSAEHGKLLEMDELLQRLIGSEGFDDLLKSLPTGFYRNLRTYFASIQKQLYELEMNSLAINQAVCFKNETEASYEAHLEQDSNQSVHGPILTSNCLSILLTNGGELRSTGLGELPEWRAMVRLIRDTVWSNATVMRSEFDQQYVGLTKAQGQAERLLKEIDSIRSAIHRDLSEEQFVQDFNAATEELGQFVEQSRELRDDRTGNKNRQWQLTSLLNSLRGVIELNLMVYLPLLDPVEKNALKKTYTDQDIQHYQTLVQAYEYMAIVMNYRRLGEATKQSFLKQLEALEEKRGKLCRKVALRPVDNIYTELAKDVNNFLISCCYPGTILAMTRAAKLCLDFEIDTKNPIKNCTETKNFQLKVNETIKQIELWINIANKFEHHTLKRYEGYYRDFLEPVCCAIATLKYGLTGLKHCLTIKRDSVGLKSANGVFYDLAEKDALGKILQKFVQFPMVSSIKLFDEESSGHKVNIYSVLEKIDHSEANYFRLLKSKLQEVKNAITLRGAIGEGDFVDLDRIVNVCNQIWQKQEHLRRKKQAEEDSLYQTKSHCEEESEEVMAQREIGDMFPNYVDEDFADFIQNDTLEQVIKVDTVKRNARLNDTVCNEDYALICESFIYLMNKFSKSYYYNPETVANLPEVIAPDFVGPFRTKTAIFYQLLHKYRSALNSTLDESFYPGLSFLIGMVQEKYDDLDLNLPGSHAYNFYKDSNITEVVQCVEVLKKVEASVQALLLEWPDHAGLKDIIKIIERIHALPSTAPIVRFSTGLQLLRSKIDEWNAVAHRLNNLRELEADIVEFVHRWMRMELQYWRECMSRTHEAVRSKAYRYWFFMYNLLHEFLQSDSKAKLGNLLDYRKVERCFGEDELLEEDDQVEEGTVKIEDLVHVLKQFIESSNYAEFANRLRILKSFEQYLMYLNFEDNRKKDTVIAVLHNLHMYYDQFSAEIEEFIKSKRNPIEKKLKEFVKIESFNKDLSYFSMRNNIARVHRQLHKFLKEFENEIKAKILPVFSPKDPAAEINDADQQKNKSLRSEAKITYYMVDVKNFMASPKLKEKFSVRNMATETTPNQELFGKIDRFFVTSRNVVKEAILHAPFPGLIYSLDTFMHDQIETIEYLSGLEVNRDQPKPKQKSQAKQILNQKRKALSDFYKSLTQLGLSYRSGIVESAIESDPVDVTIKPFSVDLLAQNSKYRKVDQHIVFLNDKLDLYYVKCVFKIKMLMKVMLQPNADVGLINIDRIKGFAIDLFLLVQNQQKELGKSVANVFELRDRIQDLTQLGGCLESKTRQFNFERSRRHLKNVNACVVQVQSVLEQFNLLLKCVPAEPREELKLLKNEQVLTQSAIVPIVQLSNDCLKLAIKLGKDLKKSEENYIAGDLVRIVDEQFGVICAKLEALGDQLKFSNCDERSIYAKPIVDLLEIVRSTVGNEVAVEESSAEQQTDEESLNNELENIIHSILIAMQQIYKKYSTPKPEAETPKETSNGLEETEEAGPESELQPQHLKEKINSDLLSDLQSLNIRKVVTKIGSLLSTLESLKNPEQCAAMIQKLTRLIPILEQFNLLVEYYLIQQLGAHKIATKMLSVMLTVFIELGTKGFCIPKDLMDDEEAGGEQQEGNQGGEKFGFEDGEGEKDVSNKIESEDQLDDAKKPGQEDKNEEEEKDNKEEKGIDMSEDFDSKLQDVDKPEGSDSEDENKDDEEDIDKQMGDAEEGEKLDDQIWGDDEQKEEEEKEDEMDEEDGKGSGETDDKHNNLDSEKDKAPGEEQDGTDAIDQAKDDSKKEKPKDIEDMNNQEGEEEQENPHHNELEEPPQPDDLDLDEEFNLDNDDRPDGQNGEEQNEENPFDIDQMKENGENEGEEEAKEDEAQKEDDQKQENGDDSSDEEDQENPDGAEKLAEDENQEGEDPQNKPEDEEVQQIPDEHKDEQPEEPKTEEEQKSAQKDQPHHESKDKRSEQDRIEAMPDTEHKGTNDQVANEPDKPETRQETELDEQDTGEDRDGVGQAENEQSETGHQGIAESKDTRTKREQNDRKQREEKRRQGNTDEERSLGDPEKAEKKRLKTVDELNREERGGKEEEGEEDEGEKDDSEEYQHVKDAKQSDKTTLDNATEEQSKKVQHQENKEDDGQKEQEEECVDELMDVDEKVEELEETQKELLESEKNERKKDKPAKKDESQREKVETLENVEVEGEIVDTARVPRGEETTAHTVLDILNDMTLPEEPTTGEVLEMRKMVEKESLAVNAVQPGHDEFDRWQQISNKMLPNARELCEQLRLILEPTKCTRLKGDYRTGRRINMKKIIPYIASQFRKDKIWLRRTKAAQRDYKITIAVDDSKSMDHNNSKDLTLQAISLVSQALTLLESGRLNVMSFGESPKILLKHSDQFDGAKLISSLNFEQNQSRIAELLDFVRTVNAEDCSSSDNGIFENLLLVLSDGRNIFSEGEKKVKNSVKLARLQRIFVVYVIIDNPENKHSIMDIRVPLFTADRNQIVMQSYLDVFPFPYYVIVRDLGQLPLVLSDAMRQWFELVNSEQ
ncbi:midasin [Culex pipiens pallens]|nr:midasin [Culex pipiens pallens]